MSAVEHVIESAGAYVLGALPADEAHEIEAHAAGCEICRKEIAELRRVVSVLPLACPAVEPPLDLKSKIVQASQAEARAGAVLRRAKSSGVEPGAQKSFWHRSIPSWAGVAGWVGVAAACVVAGIFIGIANEHQRMLALQTQNVAMARSPLASEAASTTAGPVYDVYSVSRQKIIQPRAVGRVATQDPYLLVDQAQIYDLSVRHTGAIPCKVIQMPNQDHAMLVSNMPPLPAGHVYQIWLIREGKIHRGGIVPPGNMVKTMIPMKVERGDVIAFTMEPSSGSDKPSGRFTMEQTL